jgi:enoyl-[acyl-carrier protein] reductase I
MQNNTDLTGRRYLVTGVANRKSVAWHIAKLLEQRGAELVFTVRDEEHQALTAKLLGDREVLICNVEQQAEVDALGQYFADREVCLHGLVHSIAFANYEDGMKPFHETPKQDFLQALDISCFSLVNLANALKGSLARDAAVVTISISSTTMASENYGYMAPIKAALDSSIVFLAKSFSAFSEVRFNAVRAGLLKTSASAGIPGYLESYLYGEEATFRGRGVSTPEVAETAAFLLSPASSGINGQGIVVDAGMGSGYFNAELVSKATRIDT